MPRQSEGSFEPAAAHTLVEHHDPHQLRWVSGTARTGRAGAFFGEGSGDRERYRVVTYRCTRCFALESFAIEPT